MPLNWLQCQETPSRLETSIQDLVINPRSTQTFVPFQQAVAGVLPRGKLFQAINILFSSLYSWF
jgi:hypothetical protein